jgi:hypothetical protein
MFANIIKFCSVTTGNKFESSFIPRHVKKINPHVAYNPEERAKLFNVLRENKGP